MERRDRFDFAQSLGDSLVKGLPPIVGSDGGSVWFANGAHVSLPQLPLEDAGATGFYLGIDLQAEQLEEAPLMGAIADKAIFRIRLTGKRNRIFEVEIQDPQGRRLCCQAETSAAAARRILLTGVPHRNSLRVHELQGWARSPGSSLHVEVLEQGSPQTLVPMGTGVLLAGCKVNGEPVTAFVGRLSEIFVGGRLLVEDRIQALTLASDNPLGLSHGALGTPTQELVRRFQRDLVRLRRWGAQKGMSADDLDDAALLLYRWFFDKHPIVFELARKIGVQFCLPGITDRERGYLDTVLAGSPLFQMSGSLGADSMFGFRWCSPDAWRAQPAFHISALPVSHEAFVKFVRNKLGAGHFDEKERRKWQRELLELSSVLKVMGQDALSFQMKAIVDAVLQAIAASRLEALST